MLFAAHASNTVAHLSRCYSLICVEFCFAVALASEQPGNVSTGCLVSQTDLFKNYFTSQSQMAW